MDRGWRNFYVIVFATGALIPNIVLLFGMFAPGSAHWVFARAGYQMGQGILLALWCVFGNQAFIWRLIIAVTALAVIMTLASFEPHEGFFFRSVILTAKVIPAGLAFLISAPALILMKALSKNTMTHSLDSRTRQSKQFSLRTLLYFTFMVASILALLRLLATLRFILDTWQSLLRIATFQSAFAIVAAAISLPLFWIVLSDQRNSRKKAFLTGTIALIVCSTLWYILLQFVFQGDSGKQFPFLLVLLFCSTYTTCLGLVALRWLGYRLRKLPLQ